MMDQKEGMRIWLTLIILFCLIFALVFFIYKEMPDFFSSVTSKPEKMKMEILLRRFG